MTAKKKVSKTEVKDKMMKKNNPSHATQPIKKERFSLLKTIFLKLRREDVV